MDEPELISCSTCGWFLHRNHCRDDLKQECENAEFDGFCVEESNNVCFMPQIVDATQSRCGKWVEAMFAITPMSDPAASAAFRWTQGRWKMEEDPEELKSVKEIGSVPVYAGKLMSIS